MPGLADATGADVMVPSFWPNFFNFFPLFRLPEFLFGMVLGILFCQHSANGFLRKLSFPMTLTGLAAVCLACAWAAPQVPYYLLHNCILWIPFGAIILGVAQSDSFFARLVSGRWFRSLGSASYAAVYRASTAVGVLRGCWASPGLRSAG